MALLDDRKGPTLPRTAPQAPAKQPSLIPPFGQAAPDPQPISSGGETAPGEGGPTPPLPSVDDTSPVLLAPKIKLTRKVRRGLALMRSVLLTALDGEDTRDPRRIVATWPGYLQSDFNAGMAWIEQNEEATR